MSYFVTGTDTGVGKTLVSCALLHAFAARGVRAVGMKPVAAGCNDDGVNDDVIKLRAASNVLASYGQMNPYNFHHPIAPHIAARNTGVRIDLARILTSYKELSSQADEIIVEGIGGFKVPLNDKHDTAEMAQEFKLPVIMVVGMRLGCLNHALLTAESIASHRLRMAGWVANVLDAEMPALQQNITALEQLLYAPLLGVIDYQATPDARAVATRLNISLLHHSGSDGDVDEV